MSLEDLQLLEILLESTDGELDLDPEKLEELSEEEIEELLQSLFTLALLGFVDEEFGLPEDALPDVAEAASIEEVADDVIAEFDATVAQLESAFAGFDVDISSLGHIDLHRSSRVVVVPAGPFTLPGGITAVEERSWGQVKAGLIRH